MSTQTVTTARGETATRATKHHGNTWLIHLEGSSALVELSPAMDITQFNWDISENWRFIRAIHNTESNGEQRWYFMPDTGNDGTFTSQEVAEKQLLLRSGKYRSKYVPEIAVCYWDALKALDAVKRKYAKYLSFEENKEFGPKLMQDWGIDNTQAAWAVVWEQGSPEEWALKWGSIRREDPTDLFMEPLCSFALGVYRG